MVRLDQPGKQLLIGAGIRNPFLASLDILDVPQFIMSTR
jgi:hypothetical protein